MSGADEGEPHLATFDRRNQRRLMAGLLALVLITLAASALWVSQRALSVFDDLLLPQFDQDAEIIAQRLGSEIERAVLLGVPVDQLRGVDAFLEGYLDEHPALVYLALRDGAGRTVAAVGPSAAIVSDLVETEPDDSRLISRFVGEVRQTSFWIGDPGAPVATVLVGMDARFARGQIADMRWDILVVLVVSLLVAWEILVFLIDRTIVSPLRLIDQIVARALDGEWTVQPGARWRGDEIGAVLHGIDRLGRDIGETLMRIDRKLARLPAVPPAIGQRVESLHRQIRLSVADGSDLGMESRVNARLPLFLFVFAEELSRSFLPLYAEQIYRPIGEIAYLGPIATALGLSGVLSAEIVIGLPIMVFMAGVALATPFGGSWVTRYGSRTIFLAGAVPAGIGYLGTALAATTYDMLVWRCLSAVGYALITIACQGYLAQIGSGRARARNMAVFVAAVTTAVICGSAIGAVLADRFGFRAVFVISAGFVLLAAALASRYMHQPPMASSPGTRVHLQFRALANPRFAALILLAAIPAKIALTGFLFYIVPLFLHAIDFSQPAIGRMIMLYGIFMLAGTQIGAQLHDRRGHAAGLIGVGGVLTGVALVGPHLMQGDLVIAAAIGLFGLAQGIASAPMLAIIPQICPAEVQLYGVTGLTGLLRLTERIGSVIGPLLAAVLIVGLGYAAAIAIIGVVSALSALTFLIVFFALSNRHIGTGEVR